MAYRQVMNMLGGMSGTITSFTLFKTSPGELRRWAEARSMVRVVAITRAAGTPLSVTSPTTRPKWPLSSSREVGGDFYDFLELDNGHFGLVVGDVTDKGVPAALVMATTRTMLRASAQRLNSPGEVLKRVNDVIVSDIPPNMFITCLYAI